MIIGVDFDNTIVNYDRLFHRAAVEKGLIPESVPASKGDVRDYLRSIGGENDWIELQGIVYGVRMHEADPFPGVIEFFERCRRDGVEVRIVSHKTLKPFAGPDCNLHEAAQRWLREHGFYDAAGIGLTEDQVWFELTKSAKMARVQAAGCTHFVDDLPELLAETEFPGAVEKLLFDPNALHADKAFERLTSWAEASTRLLGGSNGSFAPPADRVRALLASAGISGPYDIRPLRGGTNNRVFRVDTAAGPVLLKAYFDGDAETRDRLGVEQHFLRFAWDRGIRCVPQLLAADARAKLGLYEFVEGAAYVPGDVTARDVSDGLAFVTRLNAHRGDREALAMPDASDSCFSGDDYLRSVDRRLAALLEMQPATAVEQDASRFVREELAPAWDEARASFASHARRIGWALDARFLREGCCVSPSDFGFHNALKARDGVRFIDFEYAGWDDPAKLVCDFFGQFEVPVPMALFDRFADEFSALFADAGAIRARMAVVLPACRFKWLAIMLNDFHPAVRQRRTFAHTDAAADERPARQLAKARAALHVLAAVTKH